jgi:hypothetical protein
MKTKFKVTLDTYPIRKTVEIDNKTFILLPHCGEGTINPNKICGFCGLTHKECAKSFTKSIKEDHKIYCGGSGFWCPECGLFYPQDSCGETNDTEFRTINGIKVIEAENKIYCGSCGIYLFNIPVGE